MDQQRGLIYGQQQGLRFALLLDGMGGAREIGWDGIRAWQPAQGLLWVHLERDDDYAARWLREESGLDAVLCDALLAEESRPRVQETNGGLHVVMRGVNRDPENNDLDLVPIHIWGNEQRLISLRDKDHYLHALRDIRESLAARRGPVRAGHLFTKIARKVIKGIEPVLDQLEDEVDDLDNNIEHCDVKESRATLSLLRRRAISLRRYMAPQREALFRLQGADVEWLRSRDRQRMRDLTDKVLRSVETLSSVCSGNASRICCPARQVSLEPQPRTTACSSMPCCTATAQASPGATCQRDSATFASCIPGTHAGAGRVCGSGCSRPWRRMQTTSTP